MSNEAKMAEMDDKKNATLNISGATVKQALRVAVEQNAMTEEQADLLWWFFAYSKQKGYSLSMASAEIGFSSNSTLWRAWQGQYGASVKNICDKVRRYRKLMDDRATYTDLQVVETSIAKRIYRACDAALISQTIVFVYGDSQIGKTTALEEYARTHNHGQTKYVRCPASAGVQLFMRELARACFVSSQGTFEGMREAVFNAIDNRTLFLIDEVHQCFLSYQKTSQMKVLELIREIYDRTKCGMVLCGTNVLRDEIQRGKLALMLEQLRRRCTHPIQLPASPPMADLVKIAAAFSLPAPEGEALELVRDMIHRSGMGMYVKYLQTASRMARKEDAALSWEHFVTANDAIAKLSSKKGM